MRAPPGSLLAALGILLLVPGTPVSGQLTSNPSPSAAGATCHPVTTVAATDARGSPTVTVAAAADLRYAMADLVRSFEAAHPDESVQVTYGSSGNFFAQISQGAPFDVFFSADIEYPRALEAAALAAEDSARLYAEGRIATWVRHDSPIDVDAAGLNAVLDPAAERVAIANPAHAPYGRAAQAAMETSGIWDEVRPRLAFGDNISQAAQFVESGAADVGIIALSLAIAPPLCLEGRYALVPAELHPPILQGALVLAEAADPEAATAFLDFVIGPQGREVLDRYGFLLPAP